MEYLVVVDTIRRGRLAEYAYEYTKRMLFDGTLAPGAKLRVEDVVASLHTSRQPVMDAFKRLSSEGYLEITPQVGCRVVVPDRTEIADFFLILGAVQGLAADVASERRTADELLKLDAIVAEIDALLAQTSAQRDVHEYHALDLRFQQQIQAMAHSDAVANLATSLLDRREFYMRCVVNAEPGYAERMREASGEHRAIAVAVGAGDAEAARTLTETLVLTLGRFALGTTIRQVALSNA